MTKPHIINIMSASLDGKIALHENESSSERLINGLTSSVDQEHLKQLIATCDVVLLGLKSFQSERGVPRVAHLRSQGDEPHWIFLTRQSPVPEVEFRQKDIPLSIWKNSLEDLWQWLQDTYPGGRVALLGGGQLNAVFWQRGWVDELHITLCPLVVGQAQAPSLVSGFDAGVFPVKLELVHTTCEGGYVFCHYRRPLSQETSP
jgi:riboflavin biosynthesis pyrimidine reductase